MECQTLCKTLNIQQEIKEIQFLFLEWNLKTRQPKQAVKKHEVIEVYMESTVSKKVPRREMPLGSNPRFQFVGCYLLDNKILCFLNEDFPLYFISGFSASSTSHHRILPHLTQMSFLLFLRIDQKLPYCIGSLSIWESKGLYHKGSTNLYCILPICWAKMQLPYWLLGTSIILFTKCSEQHPLFTHSIYKIYINAIVIITCKFI